MHLDVLVIGAGQAGVPLCERLARAGRRVLLAERARLGGTCVNTGCTPTKTLYAIARAAHVARTAGRLGVRAGEVSVDFAAAMRRKDEVVAQWRAGVERRLRAAGERLTVVHGHARFVGERTVEVNGERHTADAVVVNVGARAAVPPVEGLERLPWLDNGRALALPALPGHLVVLGGGYIGCELAQVFRRFGAQVTIVEPAPHLLGREDPEVSEAVEEALRREEIALRLGARVLRASGGPGEVRLALEDGAEVAGTHLLVATGRQPNTGDLGLDAAGVAADARGFVPVDEQYRTSAEGVYAVGDVTGGPQFTHTSWDDHRILYDVLGGLPARLRSQRVIPYAAFTDPQVGGVGLTEREARKRGIAYELATLPFGHVARAIEMDETAGVIRILVDPASERILGAAVVGAEAGELVHVLAALVAAGAPARALVDMEVAHPTLAEGLQSALMSLDRFRLA